MWQLRSVKYALVTKSCNLKTGIKNLPVRESRYQFSRKIMGGKLLDNF